MVSANGPWRLEGRGMEIQSMMWHVWSRTDRPTEIRVLTERQKSTEDKHTALVPVRIDR